MSPGDARSPGPIDSVLMIGFGGPTAPDQVLPFLARVTEGRGIPQARLLEAAHHYELVGGRSPYTPQTLALADSLASWLADHSAALPVHVGMRNWEPFLLETIERMAAAGHRHAAGIILATHRSEVSRDRYRTDVAEAIAAADVAFHVTYLPPWYDDPAFIEACASRIEQAAGLAGVSWPADLPLIFTAHSIPTSRANASPYISDIMASCRAVAARLGAPDWQLAWQSRSGDPRTPWLEPDIRDVVRERAGSGARQLVVFAIGFLSDHVEVLYDLDIEAADKARSLGVTLHRATGVIDHPGFIAMLGERVLAISRPRVS